MEPRGDDHDGHDDGRDAHRPQRAVAVDSLQHRAGGDDNGVLAVWSGDADGGRDLLEEDDEGDSEGESLDHRPGHVGEEPADPDHTADQHHRPGEQADDEDSLDAVASDDANGHAGHHVCSPGLSEAPVVRGGREQVTQSRRGVAGGHSVASSSVSSSSIARLSSSDVISIDLATASSSTSRGSLIE